MLVCGGSEPAREREREIGEEKRGEEKEKRIGHGVSLKAEG
jgi:hypothetical protein